MQLRSSNDQPVLTISKELDLFKMKIDELIKVMDANSFGELIEIIERARNSQCLFIEDLI